MPKEDLPTEWEGLIEACLGRAVWYRATSIVSILALCGTCVLFIAQLGSVINAAIALLFGIPVLATVHFHLARPVGFVRTLPQAPEGPYR